MLHGERMKHLHDLVEHMSYEAPKAERSTFQNLQGPLIYLFHVSGGTFTFTERDTKYCSGFQGRDEESRGSS